MNKKTQTPKPKQPSSNPVSGHYLMLFSTPSGQAVLDDLKKRFSDVDLQGKTPEDTMINVGGHKLVRYITMRIEDNAPN